MKMRDGSVFPMTETTLETGLTTREWFAGMVMSGGNIRVPRDRPTSDGGPTPEQQYAREVLRMVDAVLEEIWK